MARALDIHPALLELCHVRYREALADRPAVPRRADPACSSSAGGRPTPTRTPTSRGSRGSSGSRTASAGRASPSPASPPPSVDEALTVCRRLGFARIVVQPYFLFDGVLLKRIARDRRAARRRRPGVSRSSSTAHFRVHPLLLQAFEDRAHEAVHGSPHMNCDLCKYRVRLIGREADLGVPRRPATIITPARPRTTRTTTTHAAASRRAAAGRPPAPTADSAHRIPGTSGCSTAEVVNA